MSVPTLFDGNFVVVDAMVIINFHVLRALEKLIDWAAGEIVIERHVKIEADRSKAGKIDLEPYIQKNLVIDEEIRGEEQEELFYHYFGRHLGKAVMHEGEAACLALAISKGYGLACDERAVRDEFREKCPDRICVHSCGIVDRANGLGLVKEKDAKWLKKGFYLV